MLPQIDQIKGIHPGLVLERELKRLDIGHSVFAMEIGEYPTIITDIIKKRRGISAALSIKLDKYLNAEEGYFLILQSYFKIGRVKQKASMKLPKPDLTKLRKALFWDISIDILDFSKRKRFVIERVFERGNEKEIREIINFYGTEECRDMISSSRNMLASGYKNGEKYLGIRKTRLNGTKTS